MVAELNSEQSPVPPQNIKSPTAVWVFGVLSIVFGCYHLFNMSISSYTLIRNVWNRPDSTTGQLVSLISLQALVACLWIWLIITGFGLLTDKKWSRRQSILCALVQIILFVALWSYNLIIIGIYMPEKMSSFIVSMLRMADIFVYSVLLLIFMQTRKVKDAFVAVGG